MPAQTAVPSASMNSGERRAVAGLAAVASVRMLGLFMLLPVLALYSDSLVGATPLLVGVSVGAYGITQAMLQIPFGVASDRFGRRPVLLLGLGVFAVGGAIAALGDHIGWVIAGRIVQGAGAVSAVLNALLADLTRESVRTRAQAVFGASIGLSFMVSLMVGPALAARLGVDGLFVLTSVLAALAFAGVAFLSPPQHAGIAAVPRSSVAWTDVLQDRTLHGLYFGIFALHLIIAAAFVALPFVLRDQLGLEPERHGLVYLLTVAVSVLSTVALIRGVERSARPRWIVALAVTCLLLAQPLFALTGTLFWTVAVGLVLLFTGINFLEARLPAEVTLVAGADRRGAALGVYATCQFLGIFVGGACGGALLGRGSPSAVFVFVGAVAALWLVSRLRAPAPVHEAPSDPAN